MARNCWISSLLDIAKDVRRANEALFLDEPRCSADGCALVEEDDDALQNYGMPDVNGVFGDRTGY